MPGYFALAWDPKKKRPGGETGLHDGDWWELMDVATSLREAAQWKEPLDGAERVPTAAELKALPSFSPEHFVLLGDEPEWKELGKGGGARWCSPATVAGYARAVRAVDDCVGSHHAREAWERYRDAVERLAKKKLGLYVSTDE
jgi:hypothetical protein